MSDLRDLVIEAHGGHKRWKRFRTIEAECRSPECFGAEKDDPMQDRSRRAFLRSADGSAITSAVAVAIDISNVRLF